MEWTVVLTLVTLVGLFSGLAKPVLSLNSSITKLTENVAQLTALLEEYKKTNHEAHKALWQHNKEQDAQLADHETRLLLIERGDGE